MCGTVLHRNRALHLPRLTSFVSAAGLGKRLDATLQNLGLKPPGSAGGPEGPESPVLPPAGGPLSGRLFVEGSLGGSVSRPQAAVQLRVEDGAVGGAMLGRAEVS